MTRSRAVPIVPPEDRLKQLADYRNHLLYSIAEDVDRFFNMNDIQRARFEKSSDFGNWKEPKESAMFTLTGHPEYSVAEHQYHCWVSPIIFDLVHECRKEGCIHAYELLPVKGSTKLETIVLSPMSQILLFRRHCFEDGIDQNGLYAKHQRVTQAQSSGELDLALIDLSLAVLYCFDDSEILYFLVDRVERCEGSELALLRILASVAKAARCTVKIFANIDGPGWTDFDPVRHLKEHKELMKWRTLYQSRTDDEDD